MGIFNFENIGKKIKNLTKWLCWITILLTWIVALVAFFGLLANDYTAKLCWIPVVVAIVASFFIWISSWAIYAFGELVDKVSDIERNIRFGKRKSEAQLNDDYERISKIEKLRSQGLITEEEYQQAISKEQ